jgi:predicted RNA methylase
MKVDTTKLRLLAKGMQPQIEAKLHPAITNCRPTRRRAGIAEGMFREAQHLQKIQKALRALADAHDNGLFLRQPKMRCLMDIKTRVAVERVFYEDEAAARLLEQLMGDQPIEVPKEVQLRRQEAQLIGLKIPGFFTTPPDLAARMVRMAGIQPDMRVLEPSAGSGNIADAIREACPGCYLILVEINGKLVDILKSKGYAPVMEANGESAIYLHTDFLNFTVTRAGGFFDRIIMNPPFEHGQDVDHVRHAFDLLKRGGRLVAIMSEHPVFASDAAIFRSWFVENYGSEEKLPAGTFQNQATSTSVSSRLVIIPKM